MNRFFIVFLIIVSLTCCNRGKAESKNLETNQPVRQTETEMQTKSLANVLKDIKNINNEKQAQLIIFISGALKYNGKPFLEETIDGNYGVRYSYNSNGKYLFVIETEFGAIGSSYEKAKTYIFDTESIKLISADSIFKNADAPNPSFHGLVIEYLSKEDGFDKIEWEYIPKAEQPINDYGFNLFYAKNGIGLRWNEGDLAAKAVGPFIIVLPYSKAQIYLTPTGKEVFK